MRECANSPRGSSSHVSPHAEAVAAQQQRLADVETYSNGVRHVKVPDPDGNAIAFAELPNAANA